MNTIGSVAQCLAHCASGLSPQQKEHHDLKALETSQSKTSDLEQYGFSCARGKWRHIDMGKMNL